MLLKRDLSNPIEPHGSRGLRPIRVPAIVAGCRPLAVQGEGSASHLTPKDLLGPVLQKTLPEIDGALVVVVTPLPGHGNVAHTSTEHDVTNHRRLLIRAPGWVSRPFDRMKVEDIESPPLEDQHHGIQGDETPYVASLQVRIEPFQVSLSHLVLRAVRRCRPEPARIGLVQVSERSKAVPLDLQSGETAVPGPHVARGAIQGGDARQHQQRQASLGRSGDTPRGQQRKQHSGQIGSENDRPVDVMHRVRGRQRSSDHAAHEQEHQWLQQAAQDS